MEPLATIKRSVMMRLPRDTEMNLQTLARSQGLRTGPFAVHVMQTIAQCPPENFHVAMAEFQRQASRR
jgi:hypothetical protein